MHIHETRALTHWLPSDSFFNDRAWLRTEFPELAEALKADVSKSTLHDAASAALTLLPCIANDATKSRLDQSGSSRLGVDPATRCTRYWTRMRTLIFNYMATTSRERPWSWSKWVQQISV
jgi:hypothetical protein